MSLAKIDKIRPAEALTILKNKFGTDPVKDSLHDTFVKTITDLKFSLAQLGTVIRATSDKSCGPSRFIKSNIDLPSNPGMHEGNFYAAIEILEMIKNLDDSQKAAVHALADTIAKTKRTVSDCYAIALGTYITGQLNAGLPPESHLSGLLR